MFVLTFSVAQFNLARFCSETKKNFSRTFSSQTHDGFVKVISDGGCWDAVPALSNLCSRKFVDMCCAKTSLVKEGCLGAMPVSIQSGKEHSYVFLVTSRWKDFSEQMQKELHASTGCDIIFCGRNQLGTVSV